MPKSLEMSSGGLDFDTFMKALVRAKPETKKGKTRIKRERSSKSKECGMKQV
jgi:hypothetical protein